MGSSIRLPASLLLLAVVAASPAVAKEKGDASLRVEYQYIRTGAFDSSIGDIDIGHTDGHVVMFSGDYALNDRWTVSASLPWIRKRHKGAFPHNAVNDFTNFEPPDLRVVDDGKYHSSWQDLYVGVSYLAKEGRLTIEPFVAYGVPTNDYPFYGHAAVGRNLWHVPVGASFHYTPLFSDWRLSGNAAYVFTEQTLGVDISHWLIYSEASYYVSDSFAPKIFLSIKHGTEGLDWPDDFDITTFDSEESYYHDRTIKHNFVNGGVGFDWRVNDKYVMSATWFTMIDPDQVNTVERAWTIGFTRYFSAGGD